MMIVADVVDRAGFLLMQFLHSDDKERLIEDFQELTQEAADNRVLKNLKEIMVAINEWNLVKIETHTELIISEINNASFIQILKVFKNQLLSLVLDRIIDKAEKTEFTFQAYLNKTSILNEALQISKQIEDEVLILKYLEKNLNNYIVLGLLSLHAEIIEKAFKFFANALDLVKDYESNFPKQHSFLLRIIPNLLLKVKNSPKLFDLGVKTLGLDSTQKDPYQFALHFLEKAISLDEEFNYSPGLASDYYNLAYIHSETKQIKEAVQELKKAQEIHEQIEDSPGILNDIILLGMLIHKTDKFDESLRIFENALNIAKDLNLKGKIAEIYFLIGTINYEKKEYQESLKNFRAALVIFKQDKTGSTFDLIDSYNWIGLTLRDMEKFDDIKKFIVKILEVEKQSKSRLLLMHLYAQLALTDIEFNNQDEFEQSYQEILALYYLNKEYFQYANIEYQIGIAFCQHSQFQTGLTHLLKAFEIYHKQQNLDKIQQIIQTLSTVYNEMQQPDFAAAITDETVDLKARSQMIISKITLPKDQTPKLPMPLPTQISPTSIDQTSKELPPESPTETTLSPTIQIPTAVPISDAIKEETASSQIHPTKPTIPIAVPIHDDAPASFPKPKLNLPPKPKISPPSTQMPIAVPITDDAQVPSVPPMPKPFSSPKPEKTESTKQPVPIVRICPQCQFQIENPDFTFCPKCATKLTRSNICHKCGFEINNSDFKFCPKCANPLD